MWPDSARAGTTMRTAERLRAHVQSVRARTLAVLRHIPRDRVNWRPAEGMLTLGQLVRHLAQSEMMWQEVVKGHWDLKQLLAVRRDLDLIEATGPVENLMAELTLLEVTHQQTLELLATLTDEDLARSMNGLAGRVTLYDVILGLCEHEAHHRGQIVAYLRMLGVEHPSPWGF
ncbi:MAG: DinB family protein [Blastocatellia bacterium]|nr:DinB family protein [Blastocatellia bacterium]MCS7156640.1 DinB family protein [Blastocatellia bacterium]MCX7751618.1 DinB family protein [Blastocatellia bacterium]MDW8168718.1 DinB family protein [Acidobacteriota bacterium]MDW8256984.1 DinB family protein [Acidobacteriota bacterium]